MTDFISTINQMGEFMPSLLKGSVVTVQLFLLTIVLSLPLGFPIALGSNSKFKVLRGICKTYVWIFRGTPLLLQLFFFYFYLPIAYNIELPAFTAAVVTFVLNYAAYFAEIYRGGINSIDRGQFEAAHSLGLNNKQTMVDIILPQTMKAILPPVVNETITLVKDTALASVIPVVELMKVSRAGLNRTSSVMPLLLAGLIYLVMTFVLTIISNKLEKRFSKYDAKEEW
ncbi:MAG: amino acid ABC transporter permease [Anaerovoracaceae bacterium]